MKIHEKIQFTSGLKRIFFRNDRIPNGKRVKMGSRKSIKSFFIVLRVLFQINEIETEKKLEEKIKKNDRRNFSFLFVLV